jgi:hypothetical protein
MVAMPSSLRDARDADVGTRSDSAGCDIRADCPVKPAMMVGTRDRQLLAGRPALGLWLEFGPDLSSSCSVQQGEQSSANRLANFTDTPAHERRVRRQDLEK